MTVDQFLALQGCQAAELHVEDRLCLQLIDAEQLDEPVTCDIDRGRSTNQGDDLIQGVKGLKQPAQNVSLLFGLAQSERRPPLDDVHLVLDPVPDESAQRQRARHSVNQGQHVGTEGCLQLGVLVEVVEYDFGHGVALEHDDQSLAGAARGLVADVSDPGQATVLHQLGDLLRETVGVDLVWQLGHNQADAVLNLLNLDHCAHDDRTAPRAVRIFDSLAAQDERAGGKVRALNLGHQIGK